MEDKFKLLECADEDIISFDGTLRKFSNFKQHILEKLTSNLDTLDNLASELDSLTSNLDDLCGLDIAMLHSNEKTYIAARKLSEKLSVIKHEMDSLKVKLRSFISTPFNNCNMTLNLSSPRDGEECEILRLGSHQWQKGKLRFNAFIEVPITYYQESQSSNIEFALKYTLEFYPDAPDIPESPLDDLRKMINNEKNTAN